MEELYDAFIRKLLRHDAREDLHMICDSREFSRAYPGGKDRRQAWKQQYYYRCLTVQLAHAFISALGQGRNYVTAADVYNQFPHYNFHTVFQMICKILGGDYRRGKCYTSLAVEDFKYFIQLRNATRTVGDLMEQWRQYLSSRARASRAS